MHYLGDKSAYTENEKYHILKERFGESTDAVVEQFEMVYPKLDILYALSVDAMFRPLTKEILEERSAYTDAPCYNYMMNFIIPYMGGLAVWHCGDIPFVFRNVEMESAHCTAVVLESIYKRKSAADDFCREMWNG
ncbi:hypothetical protein [Clostridium sp. C105KSO13]|uniref:hypothetical protein n=1 Tax=Clostridium sp. C105KSO13 TaxID=1776045 RepID=UPI0007405A4D|nr:hypothetical protein [Clostridium sp. C105KSO13]CUX14196.1 hypothetical protein BN3456_00040 [Clostridium sp. C105KSO13]